MIVAMIAALAVAQGMDFGAEPAKPPPTQPAPTASPAPAAGSDTGAGLQTEGVRRAHFNEIERGFFLRLPVGMSDYLTPVKNTSSLGSKSYGAGLLMGFELGYDILSVLDIRGFFYYSNGPGAFPRKDATGNIVSGDTSDLTTLYGGLAAQFSYFHTQRLFLGVKAGAGYGMLDNLVQKKQLGVAVIAALTAEYYTRLRHLSLGLDAGVSVWTTPIAVALTIVPAVRWTY